MPKNNFSKEFLTKIKEMLLEEKTRLQDELSKFTKKNAHNSDDYNSTFPEYGEKDDENAAEIADYAAEVPLEQTLENSLRDNAKATTRIEDGTYGVCKYCKKPIDEKRLLARPTSNACISCKKAITQEV
ncbi:MAG: hypothetical protein ACD_72C00179G0001 [uncultured bacterium]|nr:MAG: hypothetical protein ACD_72C00179G0001 [uncultured bacterium]